MRLYFHLTTQDYEKFLTGYIIKRNLVKRIAICVLVSAWIPSQNFYTQPFVLSSYILRASAILVIFFLISFLIPYIIAKIKLDKQLKLKSPVAQSFILGNEGIGVESEYEKLNWEWNTIRYAGRIEGYVYVRLFIKKTYIIPSTAFPNEKAETTFLYFIKNNIDKARDGNKFRKIQNLYYWGLLGIIPIVGFVSGIWVLIRGIQYKKAQIIAIGATGMLLTVLYWTYVLPKIVWSDNHKSISQYQLTSLVKNVEYYKLLYGHYPDSLPDLLKDDKSIFIVDMIQSDKHKKKEYFQYEKVGDKYFLFSSGIDGVPHTYDDIYPIINTTDSSKLGLLIPNQ